MVCSKVVLAFLGVLAVLSIWSASGLRVDTSMEVWFLDDDPDLVSYRHFLEHFDSDQVVLMAWQDPELWTAEGLAFVDRVSRAAQELRLPLELEHPYLPGRSDFGVQRVRSITNVTEVLAEPGMLQVAPLYDAEEPLDPEQLRARVLSDEQLVGGLISADGSVVAVVLDVDPLVEDIELKSRLARSLTALAAELGSERGVQIVCAGSTMLDEAFMRYTQRDMKTVIPGMGLVILVAILLLFGSPRALLLPMSVVALTSLLVAGLMAAAGLKLTIVHTIVFPMMLGIGVASSVHVLTRAISLRRSGESAHQASRLALERLLAPCFFTMATTVAGLLSLTTASLAPVRELGWLGASGAAISFLLTFALGPRMLPLLPELGGQRSVIERLWVGWDQRLERLGRLTARRSLTLTLAALGLFLFCLLGFLHLEVGSNPLNYFMRSDPVRSSLEFVEDKLSGTTSLEVFIDTGRVGGMKEPAVLAAMGRVQQSLEQIDGVSSTVSLFDYVVELRRAFRGGAEQQARVPDSRDEVAQLLVMLDDPSELEAWVDFEFQRGRINASLRMADAEQLAKEVDAIDELLAREFPAPLQASATGMSKLITKMESYLLQSQLRSLALAFITVLIFMMLAFGNLKLGVFAMIPNLIPIGMSLGGMGWIGMTLDPGTAMTGAVALGLVVDDTVHFIHHLRHRLMVGDDLTAAIIVTLRETGRAITVTSVVLVAGFWLLCLASFVPNIQFGFLCGLAIALALVANLVVLPAVLSLFRPNFRL